MSHWQAMRVRLLLSLAGLGLIGGATWLAVLHADRTLRADLLQQARLVAAALDPGRLAALRGTPADLAAPDYQRLKVQLALVRAANPRCRLLYLLRRGADGATSFLIDSEPAEARDGSAPGQAYDQAPGELGAVFASGRGAVHGPYHDRRGTWASAFVPAGDPLATGARAVLGMDVSAFGWRWTVVTRAALPGVLAAVAVLLGLLAATLQRHDREVQRRADELDDLLRRMINGFAIYDSVFDERGEFVSYRFVYINDAYERITAVKRNEVLGKTVHDVWPDLEPAWVKAYGEVAVSGVSRELDLEHGPTGKHYHCRVYRPGAGPERFCVILEDITESRRLEDEIQRERGNLQAVLDASPVGMLVFDEGEEILLANPAAEAMFGTPAGQLQSRRCGDFLRCRHRTGAPEGCGSSAHCPSCELAAAIKGALAGDSAQARRQGEALVTVQAAATPVWLSFKTGSAIVGGRRRVVMALDDITERKQAEEQVRTLLAASDEARLALLGILEDQTRAEADRKRLATAIEQAAEVIVVTDTQGQIQYVNPAFEAVTGYSRDEAIGRNPRLLKSGQHDVTFYRKLWETIGSGKTWHGRFVNTNKAGARYTEEVTISPVRDKAGIITNYVAVKRDLTEHLRLQTQLLQAQKLESIGTLAGGVAHEINNPIMGIMNYAQLIKDAAAPNSPTAEFAGEIVQETERVAKIVKNLLQFARAEEETQPGPAHLVDIVDDTLSLIRTVMRHDQIDLVAAVPEELPQIRCRSRQIQQVIMNLLTNARDALNERYPGHDANKTITITARPFGKGGSPWLRVTIEDRGMGIPESLRERIFEPFFTTKPRDKGTGLGLSISYGIVKDHGGQLSVESEVGHWTRFHVDLPAVAEEAE